jgi:hypothetical protein
MNFIKRFKEEKVTFMDKKDWVEFICSLLVVYLFLCFGFWTFNPKTMYDDFNKSLVESLKESPQTTEERLIQEKQAILDFEKKNKEKKIQAEKICGKVRTDAWGDYHCDR